MDHEIESRTLQYIQRKLPENTFAIVRMTWFYDGEVDNVEEVRIIDEGQDTIDGFIDAMKAAVEAGADVSIISPYDPEDIGLEEQ
jgi:hypothetical protein|tara:strand:- start:156 stop:410 length:255 start_codon:yes stop_codon:yes gene_type:complete